MGGGVQADMAELIDDEIEGVIANILGALKLPKNHELELNDLVQHYVGGDCPFDRSSGLRFRRLLGNTRTYLWVVGVYQYSHIAAPQCRLGQPKGAPKGGPAGPQIPGRATWGCLGAF